MKKQGLYKQELYQRGQRNIEDAIFIKEHVVSVAMQYQRWNIVVFEAQRVTELILKGIICLTGHTPRWTHKIDTLVNRLCKILSVLPESETIPLFFAIYAPNGDGYGVCLDNDTIYCYRRDNNVYTQLGPSLPASDLLSADKLLKLNLEIAGDTITLSSEGRKIISRSDVTYSGAFKLQRGFVKEPNSKRIVLLQKAGSKLNENREKAFYGQQAYSEKDAISTTSLMNEAIEAAACFFVMYSSQ